MSGIPTLSAQPLTGAAAPSIVPYRPAGAEQMQQFGAAVQGFGKVIAQEADQLQDKLDESSAMAGLRDFAERQRAILRDPTTGYLGTVGQNAVAQRAATIQALEEARKEAAGTLGSQQAQALFARQADVRMSEAQWDIDGHAGREAREFDVQETSRTIDLYADEAVEWYGRSDPGGTVGITYKQRRQSALDQFDRLASLRSVSKKSPTYQDLRRKVSGKIAAGVTAKLLEVDPDKAWGFLREAQKAGDLDPETDRSLMAAVQKQSDLKAGMNAASAALQSTGNRGWAAELQVMNSDLAPSVQKEALRAIKERSTALEERRSAQKAEVLDAMKAWAIDHEDAGWQDWEQSNPEEATFVRKNGLLDETVEYFGSDKRGATNPAAEAELRSKPDSYWQSVTPAKFLAKYGRLLDAGDRKSYLTKITDARQAQQSGSKGVSDEKDRNRLALDQAKAIPYYMNSMSHEGATKLLAFNIRVDDLASEFAVESPDESVAERYRKARNAALLETAPGHRTGAPKYKWELTAEEQAKQGAVNAEGEVVNVAQQFAGISVPELSRAIAGMGSKLKPEELEALVTKLKDDIANDPNLDPSIADGTLTRTKSALLLPPGTTNSQIVQFIIEKRKQGLKERADERAKNTGIVSIERLARTLGFTTEEARTLLAARGGKVTIQGKLMSGLDVSDDDLAYGSATEFEYGINGKFDRVLNAEGIVGISNAAATRLAQGLAATGSPQAEAMLQTTASAQDRVRWLQEELPAQIARIPEIQAARDQYQAAIDKLDDEELGSPYAQNLRAQVAMLDTHIRSINNPDPMGVEEAWQAWLQLGGEVYDNPAMQDPRMTDEAIAGAGPFMGSIPEKWHQRGQWRRSLGLQDDERMGQFEAVLSGRPRYASMPTLAQHREMQRLYDRYTKPAPTIVPAPAETRPWSSADKAETDRLNRVAAAALRRGQLEATSVERTETIKRMSQEVDLLTKQFGSDDYAVSTLARARDDLQQLQQELAQKPPAESTTEVSTGPYGPHPALGAEHADTVIKGGEKWRSRMADDIAKNGEARRGKMQELSLAAEQIMSRPMDNAAVREVSKIRAQYEKLEAQEQQAKDMIARFRGEGSK